MSETSTKAKYMEIRTDYTDENGVMHFDGFKTDDPNEAGNTICFIVNGEPYWRDPEDQFDPKVKELLAEFKKKNLFPTRPPLPPEETDIITRALEIMVKMNNDILKMGAPIMNDEQRKPWLETTKQAMTIIDKLNQS